MNITDIASPIVSNYSYIVDMNKKFVKKEEKVDEFQKILLEQIFAQSFIQDQEEVQENDNEDQDNALFSSGKQPEVEFQNQIARKALVDNLVKLDPLGLQRAFKKMG